MDSVTKTRRLPDNDDGCGWIRQLPARQTRASFQGDQKVDWVVVGGGFTGMAAARQLAALHPGKRIVLLDANRAGEGASSRNSGFLVDATLNEGTGTASDIEVFQQKYRLALAAIAEVKGQVDRHGIECDWDPCGKLYGAHAERYVGKLENFAAFLGEVGLSHAVLTGDALRRHIGTSYYSHAVWTKTSVLLHPGKLARGLFDSLPGAIEIFEDTPVLAWLSAAGSHIVTTPSGTIRAAKLIFAVNGFMPEMKVSSNRSFALSLSASMSRPLTDAEYESLGRPAPYGLLSADTMGATVRLTRDRRILIRNTCEVPRAFSMNASEQKKRRAWHEKGLSRRFPSLDPRILESSWSGIVSLSGNGHSVFGRLAEGVWAAGCYNANGLGLANLFGREIANLASGQDSEIIPLIESRSQPTRLPPEPLLGWGARLRLMRWRQQARGEE